MFVDWLNTVKLTQFSVDNKIPDGASAIRIHPACGLVENHDLGATDESQRHAETPLHPPGQILHKRVTTVVHIYIL